MNNRTTSYEPTAARCSTANWKFFVEAVRDFRTTGAIAPSSRRLAALLTDRLRAAAARPLAVLEAGAGTGSVTRELIPLLSPACRLDIVEANGEFADRLHRWVHTHPGMSGAPERIRVHEAFVEQLDTEQRYDVIVSGLPFANFSPAQVETIMDRYLELLRPGGTLTYFSYRGTRLARTLVASRDEAYRHRAVEDLLADYQRKYACGRWTVWGNLPPADVWQLRAPAPAAAGAAHEAAAHGV